MNHLDEGTIHAWLDGALDATQSAEADAHVKTCAECSAKVAEARGLIAASSRILTSLDDTPANVIPKRTVAPVRRRWSSAPWISGLAAAAVIITLWRTGGVEQPTASSEIKVPDITIGTGLPEPKLAPLPPPAAPMELKSAEEPQSRRQKVASAPSVAAGRGAGAVAGSAAPSDLAANQAAARPTAPVPAPVEGRALALRDEALKRERLSEVVVTSTAGPGDGKEAIAGCYRLPAEMVASADEITAGAVEAVARVRRPEQRRAVTSAAPTAAAAPTSQQKASADAVLPMVIVRLDTLGRVRSVADSVIGTWERLRNDSARVTANSRSAIVSGLNKVRCP